MGNWFWGYDQTTLLKTIRSDMSDEAKCAEKIKSRPGGKDGVTNYDCLAALILGGDKFVNYYMKAWNSEGNTTWTYNIMKCFEGEGRGANRSNYEKLIGLIDENFSMQQLHSTISNFPGLKSTSKQAILTWLTNNSGGVSNSQQMTVNNSAGGNNMSNVNYIIKKYVNENKQVIFTGAPGTGKTYAVTEYVKEAAGNESRYRFVQFHSSYDYTDFVEGLRPVPDGNGGNMFVRMDGIFKEFCRHIVEENLKLLKDENSNSFTKIDAYYEYMKDENNRKAIFKQLDNHPYYFIIDEINRADLGKVFGELMYGLEESYREVHNRFDTQYKNLRTYKMEEDKAVVIDNDCFKDGFFVPYNLYIIGTMNDIDRSVESFDFALRRRFIWVDIKANDVMNESLRSMRDKAGNTMLGDQMLEGICDRIKDMNNAISDEGIGLTDSYHIGPAYFKKMVRATDADAEKVLAGVFVNRIEPILREYTRGRKPEVVTHLINSCKTKLGIPVDDNEQ